MIAKSLTAAFVSMSAAAGVVWVGTPTDGDHPHRVEEPTAKETIDHMLGSDAHDAQDMEKKSTKRMAESRVVVSGEKPAPTRDLPRSDSDKASDDRRWLDKYLKDDKASADTEQVDEPSKSTMAVPTMTGLENDKDVEIRVRTKDGQTSIEMTTRETGPDGKVKERKEKSIVDREMASDDVERVVEALEQGLPMQEAMAMAKSETVSNNKIKMAPMPLRVDDDIKPMKTVEPDIFTSQPLRTYTKAEPSKLLETTKMIDDDDLRDQALFAILTYALRFDDFNAARSSLSRIQDETLGSNARARIAIRQAELGDIATALKTIEGIEDEELQDIIRVQMIETLTTPLEKRAEP